MEKSKTNWKKFDGLHDKDINYSDSPELDQAFFKNAEVIMPKNKQVITLRLNRDTLKFFKENYKQYQTKMNAVLDAYAKHANSVKNSTH